MSVLTESEGLVALLHLAPREDIINSGDPEKGSEVRLSAVVIQRPDSQTQAWAFPCESARPGFSPWLWGVALLLVSGFWVFPPYQVSCSSPCLVVGVATGH